MIERGTRDTKQATRGCGTHPAQRDTAGHAYGICSALSRTRAAQPGHGGTFVPLCPALSRCLEGLTRHPAHLGQKAKLPHGSTAIS